MKVEIFDPNGRGGRSTLSINDLLNGVVEGVYCSTDPKDSHLRFIVLGGNGIPVEVLVVDLVESTTKPLLYGAWTAGQFYRATGGLTITFN